MALWGNSDRIGAGGTVQLGDGTNLWATNDDGHYYVTGTATSFGSVGAAKTGDLIRFGTRGGGSTFFGDAVVVGIAVCTFNIVVSCRCCCRCWYCAR